MLDHRAVREAEETGGWSGRPFILTYTGKVFPYDDVSPDNIDIRDIAHSLSHLCRYTGHTTMFYSIAQHSLLVSEKMPGGPEEKLVGLLHDAAEAYTNDLASPLKKYLISNTYHGHCAYRTIQDKITAAVYRKFGWGYGPSVKHTETTQLYDRAACVFEAEGFMGLLLEDLLRYQFPMNLRGLWKPWNPRDFAGENVDREFGMVETEFLKRFEDLMKATGRENLI
jgi:5'-deoxynucleotidase YfbR-like HD superfamily hydrolase